MYQTKHNCLHTVDRNLQQHCVVSLQEHGFLVFVLPLFILCYYCLYVADVKCVKVHPDMNRGDASCTDKFLRLRDAYTVLSSTELRREYDAQLRGPRVRQQSQTYVSHFAEESVPPKQTRYRFVQIPQFHRAMNCCLHYTAQAGIIQCPLSVCLSVCPSIHLASVTSKLVT